MTTIVVKSVTGRYHLKIDGRVVGISKHLPDDWREDYNPNQPRDGRGRWTSSGGGSRGSRGGGGGLANKRVSELQEIAKKEGIDVDTLSHKRRKSVLTAAIKAKRKNKNLREEGLLKPTKTKGGLRGQAKPKPESKAETKSKTRTRRKSEAKPESGKKNAYSDSLPEAQKKNYHSVTDKKDFEGLIFNAISQSEKRTENGGVYVHDVRRKLGESVPRDKFNQWTKELQAEGKLQLSGGSAHTSDHRNTQDAISTKLNGLRFRMEPADKSAYEVALANPKAKQRYESIIKDTPPLDPLGSARKYQQGKAIKSQADFDKDAVKAFKLLNDEFQENGKIPVYKLRESLGDRVSTKDFNNFIYKKFIPTSGDDSMLTPQQKKAGLTNMLGETKLYVQLDD